MLKHEPSFIYQTIQVSHLCYESIRVMLVHQSNEQLKLSQASSSAYGGTSKAQSLGQNRAGNGATP